MADRTRYFTKNKTILLHHTLSFGLLKHLIKERNRFKYLLKRNGVPFACLNFNLFLIRCRTMDEVNKLADAAGLVNRKGLVQVLQFSMNPSNDEYKLLELPPNILESLNTGDK